MNGMIATKADHPGPVAVRSDGSTSGSMACDTRGRQLRKLLRPLRRQVSSRCDHGPQARNRILRQLPNLLEMRLASEALGVDLVDFLGAGWTHREPAALGRHLQPADRRVIARCGGEGRATATPVSRVIPS
jgi:hypothetical protein